MKKRKTNGIARRSAINFYIYTAPWLLGFLVLTLYPVIRSFILAFTDAGFNGVGKFVGFDNFVYAFQTDPQFLQTFVNTAFYVVVFVPLSLVLSFFIALLLAKKIKGLGFFRTVFYLPYITAGVAVTILWGWLYNNDYGILNYVLSIFGIQGPNWLGDTHWAMISIVIMCLWTIGNSIIIMLAGIQDIPEAYYESASIDGCSRFRQIFVITLPLCTPTLFFNLIVGTIAAFQLFNQPYILTNGGPLDATRTVSMHLFVNAFQYGKMGYASTIAWCLFIVIMTVTLIVQKTSNKWVFYDD